MTAYTWTADGQSGDWGTSGYWTPAGGPPDAIADTARAASYLFGYHFSAPNFGTNVPMPGTPIGSILVGRDAPASQGDQTNLTNYFSIFTTEQDALRGA